MEKNKINIILLLLTYFITGCGDILSPKPHGYPRVYFPERQYERWDSSECLYSFEIPVYTKMINDKKYTHDIPCWYNLFFAPFNATLHISYHEFMNEKQYDSLFEDTRKLVYKHTIRADDIEEIEINSSDGNLEGILYHLKGNTATNLSFYLTDLESNYFRGALYFNERTTPDSIAPVFKFIKKDVIHLISTFKWDKREFVEKRTKELPH
jgi:gliding motility-associated lipoprotein GldD